MINKETVLVLGAGASMDYGFPSGEGLLQDIVNILKGNLYDPGREITVITKCLIAYIACLYVWDKKNLSKANTGDQDNDYKAMLECITTFEKRLIRSNAASIDDFIDKLGEENKELKVIGKILIVFAISWYEKEDELFYKHEKVEKGHRYYGRSLSLTSCISLARGWYNHLWEKIYDNDDISQNLAKLTVISFNYDRSFEQYLFNGIRSMSNRSDQETADCINKHLVIHHVYGQLGKLPWQDHDHEPVSEYKPLPILNILRAMEVVPEKTFSEYKRIDGFMKDQVEKILDINIVCKIADAIRTYTEASKAEDHGKIIQRLSKAERLFFLGFGYHPQNIKWLKELLMQNNKQLVYFGTTYKIT